VQWLLDDTFWKFIAMSMKKINTVTHLNFLTHKTKLFPLQNSAGYFQSVQSRLTHKAEKCIGASIDVYVAELALTPY